MTRIQSMNRNAHGTWLQGELPEASPEPQADEVTIRLPEGTLVWSDTTAYIQRIHEVLVAKGWGNGPH